MSEPNPTHFKVSQKFCNPALPTTGWWVKWVGSPTHLKKLFIYLFLSNPNEMTLIVKSRTNVLIMLTTNI